MNNLLERLRGPLYGWNVSELCFEAADRIEKLETALAQCRDVMPQPTPGERPEQSWSEAIGDPMAVPAYVKETMARLERENAELRKDAERYRFIRDANRSECISNEISLYAMESLDECVGAAMEGEAAMKEQT